MVFRKAILLSGIIAFVSGCGGGGGGGQTSSTNPTLTTQSAAQLEVGRVALSGLMQGTGDSKAALTQAASAFDEAYAKNPNNPQVAAGFGITRAALAAYAIGEAFDESVLDGSRGESANSVVQFAEPLVLWRHRGDTAFLSVKTSSPGAAVPFFSLLNDQTTRKAKSRAYPNDPTPSDVRIAIKIVNFQLKSALAKWTDAKVDALETSPLELQTTDSVTGEPKVAKIGRVEGHVLRAAMKVLVGELDAALAYDLDSGSYDPNASFNATFGARLDAGETLTPTDYLPTGSFGRLTDDGKGLLAEFKTKWQEAADEAKAAMAGYESRTSNDWLANTWGITPENVTDARLSADNLKSLLSTVTTANFDDAAGTQYATPLNLAAWLDGKAPADLRAFFPSVRRAADGTLQPVAGTFTDPTFGGLFPSGIDAKVLYERSLSAQKQSEDKTLDVALWTLAF